MERLSVFQNAIYVSFVASFNMLNQKYTYLNGIICILMFFTKQVYLYGVFRIESEWGSQNRSKLGVNIFPKEVGHFHKNPSVVPKRSTWISSEVAKPLHQPLLSHISVKTFFIDLQNAFVSKSRWSCMRTNFLPFSEIGSFSHQDDVFRYAFFQLFISFWKNFRKHQ